MPNHVIVPNAFARHTILREGAAAKAWLEGIPEHVSRLAHEWDVTIQSGPRAGHVGLAWEVLRADGSAAVLKVSWQDTWSRDEASALRAWAGVGAARLLEHDKLSGSMLLERLWPERSLLVVPLDEALAAAATITHHLHAHSSNGFADVLGQYDDESPPSGTYAAALNQVRPCVEESIAASAPVLLHGDLHYGNILWSGHEWKAIDTKPAAGPPEWDYIPLLRNRFTEYDHSDLLNGIRRRLDHLTDLAGGRRREAYRFVLYRALMDADYAHRTNDPAFEHASSAIATAVNNRGTR